MTEPVEITCRAPGCKSATTDQKPYCSDHVTQNPYAAMVAAEWLVVGADIIRREQAARRSFGQGRCSHCGSQFEKRQANAKFCRPKCGVDARRHRYPTRYAKAKS